MECAAKKVLDPPGRSQAARPDACFHPPIRPRRRATPDAAFSLKQVPCPHCQHTGTLNRHSRLLGNDPDSADGQCRRGQRVFCSNRGRRGGCGRTFSLFYSDVLPRHTVSATWLWRLLVGMLAGRSLKATVESIGWPLALETGYALVRRVRGRLHEWRSRLCRKRAPPASGQSDPVLQTAEHLQGVFAGCALKEFQLQFQSSLLG